MRDLRYMFLGALLAALGLLLGILSQRWHV